LAVQNEYSNYRVVNDFMPSLRLASILVWLIEQSARTMQLLILYLLVSDYSLCSIEQR